MLLYWLAMRRARIFLTIGLLSFTSRIFSQKPSANELLLTRAEKLSEINADSALHLAESVYHSGDEKFRLKSLDLLTHLHWQLKHYDQATIFGKLYLQSCLRLRSDTLAGDAYVILGLIAYNQDDYRKAIGLYQDALPYYTAKITTNRRAIAYLNLGICRKKLSDFSLANFYFFKSAEIFEKINDQDNLSSAYNSIGLCFISLNEHEQALIYLKKALQIRLKGDRKAMIASSYNNIGFAFKEDHHPDSAISYLSKCLYLRRGLADSSSFVLTLQNLGSAYQEKNESGLAKKYIRRSISIAGKYGMKEETGRGQIDLGDVFLREKNFKEALKAANEAASIADLLKLPDLSLQAITLKISVFEGTGSFREAFHYQQLRELLKDSLFSIAKDKAISELQIRYQTSQKERDINNLQRVNKYENQLNKEQALSIIVLIVSATLLIILSVVVYRNYLIKKRANNRIQILMRDLHHRVKNNLQILSGLFTMQIGFQKNDDLKAALRENELRLSSMNFIHQKLYASDHHQKIEMKDYLSKLLAHIRNSFGEEQMSKIVYHLELSEIQLEADTAVAIGLVVNELVTNAIKYAFDQPGELFVTLEMTGMKKLSLQVRDTGSKNLQSKKTKSGFGLKLVRLMAKQINAILSEDHDNGWSYQLIIPL